ncbi:MAG TPA: glycine betaine ABC transporter substrate-binding protein [Phycisphaerales bacterium]|nr:glycine betaine ABC transporter substrate-binding protein [Phycisphaerales bacterium]HMP36242.1 glycine betaine ABC transporter substrate-binding protein [Phycisphaerales bacterium]
MAAWLVAAPRLPATADAALRVGGKAFTEQHLLTEIAARLIEQDAGLLVRRRAGLGGTDVCHAALRRGELDLYVEYTGTALVTILGLEPQADPGATHRLVASIYRDEFDLEWLPPIGFDNTYALAVRREMADALGLEAISDLHTHAGGLAGGFTAEFSERPDGLPKLQRLLGARFARSVDLDPGLMYDALLRSQVDVIAGFATDPRLDPETMAILEDDLGVFPSYRAAPVVRGDALVRHPELRETLAALAGTIDDETMRRLNAEVDLGGRSVAEVAQGWIDARRGRIPGGSGGGRDVDDASDASRADGGGPGAIASLRARIRPGLLQLAWERRDQLAARTVEHLLLVGAGLAAAIAIGIPLGIWAHRSRRARPAVLGAVEIVQTIPSLAMLAFLFALLGVLGFLPAVAALILYALLPVVVNTAAGLANVAPSITLAADAMGMSRGQRLRRVELPLAAPFILAGLRTAGILTVGIATLSTYIGAGGLGDFIARGLARNDPRLTLLGAVPAAMMAVIIGGAFRMIEVIAARRSGAAVDGTRP